MSFSLGARLSRILKFVQNLKVSLETWSNLLTVSPSNVKRSNEVPIHNGTEQLFTLKKKDQGRARTGWTKARLKPSEANSKFCRAAFGIRILVAPPGQVLGSPFPLLLVVSRGPSLFNACRLPSWFLIALASPTS